MSGGRKEGEPSIRCGHSVERQSPEEALVYDMDDFTPKTPKMQKKPKNNQFKTDAASVVCQKLGIGRVIAEGMVKGKEGQITPDMTPDRIRAVLSQ